jgi:hypothetical protein
VNLRLYVQTITEARWLAHGGAVQDLRETGT